VQQGDIIHAVNGKKVKTVADLQAAAKTVQQDGGTADSARWRWDVSSCRCGLIVIQSDLEQRPPPGDPAIGLLFFGRAAGWACILPVPLKRLRFQLLRWTSSTTHAAVERCRAGPLDARDAFRTREDARSAQVSTPARCCRIPSASCTWATSATTRSTT
jgi:hypothetical protein